jgi:hypothetical protein
MAVNPSIDNLRVVCGVNKAMITGLPASWDMAGQNSPINSAEVEKTLDAGIQRYGMGEKIGFCRDLQNR